MSLRKTKTWIAVESEEQFTAPEITGVEAELIEVPSETVEARIAENAENEAELANLAADGDELEADMEDLNKVKEAVDGSLEDEGEGLDETGARLAEIATESYCAKWSVKLQRPAVENFANEVTRRESTLALQGALNVACEGLGERAKEWFKTFFASFWKTLQGFVNEGQAMRNRAAKYKKAADKLEGTVGEITLKDPTNLYLGEKFDPRGVLAFASSGPSAVIPALAAFQDSLDTSKSSEELEATLKDVKLNVALPGGVTLTNEQGTVMSAEANVTKDQKMPGLKASEIKEAANALDQAGATLMELKAAKPLKELDAKAKKLEADNKAAEKAASKEGGTGVVEHGAEGTVNNVDAAKKFLTATATVTRYVTAALRACGKGIDLVVTESIKAHTAAEEGAAGTEVVPA